jgi:hypothetical protein
MNAARLPRLAVMTCLALAGSATVASVDQAVSPATAHASLLPPPPPPPPPSGGSAPKESPTLPAPVPVPVSTPTQPSTTLTTPAATTPAPSTPSIAVIKKHALPRFCKRVEHRIRCTHPKRGKHSNHRKAGAHLSSATIGGFTVADSSAMFNKCGEEVMGGAFRVDGGYTAEGIYALGEVYDYARSSWYFAQEMVPAEYSYTGWRVYPISNPYQWAYVWYNRDGVWYYGEWVQVTEPDTWNICGGF